MNLAAVIGIVGSVASVIALLLPAPGWRGKALHIAYGLFITLLASGIVVYQRELSQIKEIERQALKLIQTADLSSDGSQRGFMLAGLAFLEKHRERFPETFKRAMALCDNVGLTQSKQENASDRLYQNWRLTDGSDAMKGLLTGIASIP